MSESKTAFLTGLNEIIHFPNHHQYLIKKNETILIQKQEKVGEKIIKKW